MLQYSQRHTCNMINHCDRCITLLSDNDISFGLFNLFPFFICLLGDSNTLNAKEILKIYLIEQKIYPNHKMSDTSYHSDLQKCIMLSL